MLQVMNLQDRAELDRIVALSVEQLTPTDILFLCARRSYLNKTQKEEFKDVILAHDEQVKVVEA